MSTVITLSSDVLKVELWPLGARLNGVWFDGIGNLVDGASNREEALGPKKYNGAVVGPVANRIAGASAKIGGRAFEFERNERAQTTLHSGASGVHAQDWTVAEKGADAVTFELALADGHGGFPGNRTLRARYSLHNDQLHVDFTATTDALTWINLALHPYWRFGRDGRDGVCLSVDADTYLPVDALQIPTGERAAVSGTRFDLRKLAVPSTEIDHNFCLNTAPEPLATVRIEGDLGVGMELVTTAPGLQVYSGKPIGIALEPQHWPDAMHHADFPSIELGPGDRYSQGTTYRFSRL